MYHKKLNNSALMQSKPVQKVRFVVQEYQKKVIHLHHQLDRAATMTIKP